MSDTGQVMNITTPWSTVFSLEGLEKCGWMVPVLNKKHNFLVKSHAEQKWASSQKLLSIDFSIYNLNLRRFQKYPALKVTFKLLCKDTKHFVKEDL